MKLILDKACWDIFLTNIDRLAFSNFSHKHKPAILGRNEFMTPSFKKKKTKPKQQEESGREKEAC